MASNAWSQQSSPHRASKPFRVRLPPRKASPGVLVLSVNISPHGRHATPQSSSSSSVYSGPMGRPEFLAPLAILATLAPSRAVAQRASIDEARFADRVGTACAYGVRCWIASAPQNDRTVLRWGASVFAA